MSLADVTFINMCKDVIENGTSTEGEKVRPVWEDGTSAYTIKRFGVVNRYDLRKEFPALTLRKTALKSAMDEVLLLAPHNFYVWQYAGEIALMRRNAAFATRCFLTACMLSDYLYARALRALDHAFAAAERHMQRVTLITQHGPRLQDPALLHGEQQLLSGIALRLRMQPFRKHMIHKIPPIPAPIYAGRGRKGDTPWTYRSTISSS